MSLREFAAAGRGTSAFSPRDACRNLAQRCRIERFNFYFSFYGLVLGLSVAQVAGGLANAIGSRKAVRLGWLTPLLATFLLLDISSFWVQAWRIREHVIITYPSIFLGLAVALAYYISAALVFPRESSEWSDLDEHYAAHKRQVLAGVLCANVVVTALSIALRAEINIADLLTLEYFLYFVPLIALVFTRWKRVDAALLLALIVYYIAGAASGRFDAGLSVDQI